jgi:hypothetical protein
VQVVVKESDGYRLAEPVPRNLAELIANGVTLAPSGVMMDSKAKPVVEVFGYGGELRMLTAALGGTPNLLASPVDGLVLAALQNLLAQKGHYTGAIDGCNGPGVRAAIGRAAQDLQTQETRYEELVWNLWLRDEEGEL